MRDRTWAAAAGLIAAGVYAATMFPGLAGIGDTPKLQFVGSVLGTPHSPGYPLYVLLSWGFSHLPVGTVAFRINLMSVVFGSAAVALLFLVLRALGCRPSVAFAVALMIGFGRVFWSQAILAEVYTLNAFLFAGVLLFLLRWSRSRDTTDLGWSLAFFGAGLAHHLTLAMTGPALLAYAVAVDRHAVNARTVRMAIVACAAGLSAYMLLWIRTVADAPFLEVRATSLAELVTIVSGHQFARKLFTFSPREVLVERMPLVASWIASELQWYGLLLAAAGLVTMAIAPRWRRELVLVAGSAALVAFFALNYDVCDLQVFLIIPMIALGLTAGIGAEGLCALLPRHHLVAAPLALAILAVPLTHYRANVRANSHHRHTFEASYFDELFKWLPPRTAIVAESYPVDHMVLYKLLGEGAARGRRIEIISADPDVVRQYAWSGFTVLAFAYGRAALEFDVPFAVANLPLPSPRGGRHIADTEVPELAYPLSVVTLSADRARANVSGPGRPPEPMTGALWRPDGQ